MARTSRRLRRLMFTAISALLLATIAGLFLLRSTRSPGSELVQVPENLVHGSVIAYSSAPCPGSQAGEQLLCRVVRVRVRTGEDQGKVVLVEPQDDFSSRALETGDEIILGLDESETGEVFYYFVDRERRFPLTLLALLFSGVVVAFGRWRGLTALIGFAASLSILIVFVLPAILAGENPLLVSIVGSAAVAFIAIYLAHGFNLRTSAALLGTLLSFILTGLLAVVFVEFTQLTGFASEEATFAKAAFDELNLKGLLLGGIIIGSLGVLDDVTITQASAVWELNEANPGLRPRELYRAAIRIGRDHIASTVNTLVLAYAGASLPLLVLFTIHQARLGDVLNGAIVATEIVRTLVGSIGLVASVPITTALAVLVCKRLDV